MTQVVLHYAHTFEICTFHFQFQSDPYRVLKILVVVVVVFVQFRQAYLKDRQCIYSSHWLLNVAANKQ